MLFILGKTEPNSNIIIDQRNIRVTKDGFFAFGLDRDRKNDVVIKVTKNGKSETITKKVLRENIKSKELMDCRQSK